MAQGVPTDFRANRFGALRVAGPVSHIAGSAWSDELAWLLGRATHEVASLTRLPSALGTLGIRYAPSPGAVGLLVLVRPNPGTSLGDRMTIAAAYGSSSALAGTTHMLDGSTARPCVTSADRVPDTYYTVFDVSGETVGTAQELTVTSASSSGAPLGLYSVRVAEIPRSAIDPANDPTTDVGLNYVWPRPGNFIYAGQEAGDAADGMERLIGQLGQARTNVKRYLQWSTLDNDTYAAVTTSATFADPNWHFTGAGTTPRWYTRAKRLYSTSTTNVVKARLRYKSPTKDLIVRFAVTPAGGSTTNYDITCPASGTYTTATGDVQLDTSGTYGVCYVEVQTKIASTTGYLSAWSLHDNET